MKTTLLKIISVMITVLWSWECFPQTITVTPGPVTSCPGPIVVPVNVTNFNNVGAISLKLNYNNTILTYTGFQNPHDQLGGAPIVNSNGSQVIISWASITPANIGTGVLIELLFTGVPGTSSLNWNTQVPGDCEITDANMNVLTTNFVNGSATVQQPPVINTQPGNKTVLVNQNTTFTIGAVATNITYQWQLSTDGGNTFSNLSNTGKYSGVFTATLSVSNITLDMNGFKYRCIVAGSCPPPQTSAAATLTVILPVTVTLPTSSSCPGNIVVPVTVADFIGVASFSLVFSYNPAVLSYDGFQSWNPALAGGSYFVNQSGGMVYITWSSTTPVTFNGNIVEIKFTGSTGTSALTWQTQTAGSCEFSDLNGTSLTAVYNNGSYTIHAIPVIVTHPVNKIVAKGTNTSFTISATGTGLTYRWQVSADGGNNYTDLNNGGYYSGVTSTTLNITGAQPAISGNYYRCRVTGTCNPVLNSNGALLTVLPNIITQCGSPSACPGPIVVPVTVTDFSMVSAFSLTLSFNTSVLSYTGYQSLHASLSGGNFSANSVAGKVYLTWSRLSPAAINNGETLIELAFSGTTGNSALTWDTQTQGNCEYSDPNGNIIFSTWNNGSATVYQPPVITSHPANKTVPTGGNTTFSVSANGTGLGYQWQVSTNGGGSYSNVSNVSPYSGANASTLSINPVSLGMDGYLYRCFVTGTCTPPQYSNPATLMVLPPTITTTAGSVNTPTPTNIVIPITATNCNNVGSISLALNYDPSKLTFVNFQNIHTELNSGMLVVNNTGNQIKIIWASLTPANIGNGQLLQLVFNANYKTLAPLTWDTQTSGNCEYSTPLGVIIPAAFTNGGINITAMVQTASLKFITIGNGQSVCFDATQTIIVAGGGSYFIVENGGIAELVAGENIIMQEGTHIREGGYLLARIATTNNYCPVMKPIIASDENWEELEMEREPEKILHLKVYPNPAKTQAKVDYDHTLSDEMLICFVLNTQGGVVDKMFLPPASTIAIDLTGYSPGIYLIRIIQGEMTGSAKLIVR